MLFRLMVVVGLAVLLLPTDERKQAELFSTARYAVERTVTFCDRNQQLCTSGRELWAVFVRKAEFGLDLVVKLARAQNEAAAPGAQLMDRPSGPERPVLAEQQMPEPASPVAAPAAVPPLRPLPAARGTLSPADAQPQWRGPVVARGTY